MHHGGPYPACSTPLFTSVGASAIGRFARPLCFQVIVAVTSICYGGDRGDDVGDYAGLTSVGVPIIIHLHACEIDLMTLGLA